MPPQGFAARLIGKALQEDLRAPAANRFYLELRYEGQCLRLVPMRYEGAVPSFWERKIVAEQSVVALAMLRRAVRPLEAKQKTSDQVKCSSRSERVIPEIF